MKTIKIFVVCHANNTTGLGHLFRCISLFKNLNDYFDIEFYGNLSLNAKSILKSFNINYNNNAMSTAQALKALPKNSYAVIDAYDDYIEHLDPTSYYVLIDDFCRLATYPVLGVINFTLNSFSYNYLDKGAISVATGLNYFLPNPTIKQETSCFKTKIKKILILIGSDDKFNLTPRILLALDKVDSFLNIRVIKKNTSTLESKHHLDVYPIQPDINKHYQWADFCITSGGLAKYETSFLSKPAAVISLTEYELIETKSFSNANLCFDFGFVGDFHIENFYIAIKNLLKNEIIREAYFNACRNAFTINSRNNAAAYLLNCFKLDN